MILVDSSVLIDWSRGKNGKLRGLISSLPVAVCCIAQAELLHSSRDPAHRQKLLADLAALLFVPLPDAIWIPVGDNLAALRANGITVPLLDAVVATLGIENDLEVWARDPHFPTMQKVLPRLKLFQELP